MRDAWKPVCTRGEFNCAIFTAARLVESGGAAPHPFVAFIRPHDDPEDDSALWFESLDSLAEWVREMEPRSMTAHTAGPDAGEDADELLAYLRHGRVRH